MAKRKQLPILDTDPYKDIKNALREFLDSEISFQITSQVNKMLVRLLVWFIIIVVPVMSWYFYDSYTLKRSVAETNAKWVNSENIIRKLGEREYTVATDHAKYDEACRQIEILKGIKVDKVVMDDFVETVKKEFERQRQYESEVLKRQDLMLKYLLDIKRSQ